ncbi:hypothetical protein Ac42p248 [Acinetobacter phage Ac42]|uniref:hypothetical protein n=1 Tax=Acinetobacter phage Ac42 TaxID=762660 RepID=UPI0001EBCE20|nr:hypothetical protein Ac42p248 [Acinetobacter phage Ac42]ADI96484.1 hypothetical protein Ac42p248 [Acinetobacter phage Ac42]
MFSNRTRNVQVYSYNADTFRFEYDFLYTWTIGTGLPAHGTLVIPPLEIPKENLVFNETSNRWEDHLPVLSVFDLSNKYQKIGQLIVMFKDMLEDEDFSSMSRDEINIRLEELKYERIELRQKLMEHEDGATK